VELAASLSLVMCNAGNNATYRRTNSATIIDVTFARLSAPANIPGWRLLEETVSDSDHSCVQHDGYV